MATPPETSSNGTPLTWADPQHITIALAAGNLDQDSSVNPQFTGPLDGQEAALLVAAAQVWESVANVHFAFVPDDNSVVADIRVGLADLNSMGFIGYTSYHWNSSANFLSDTLLAVEDPDEQPVIATADGDLRYDGFNTTIFQDFEHELGHALGLGHNTGDQTAIMNPIIGSKNPVPNAQDIAAIQSLYGPPTGALPMTADQSAALHGLLAGTGLASMA